jgi:ubiquinone/menaquinone biosynthesis C-methylase UbiE
MIERQFEKYKTRGADYHWREMNIWNPFRYNAYLAARYQKIGDEIRALLKEYPARKAYSIVDFGCGDGVQLKVISKSNSAVNFDLSGIDLSAEALSISKLRHPHGFFCEASVYETPFAENLFDLTISCDVIEHVQDPNRMIDEMSRVTKVGGHIIVGTPLKYTEYPLDSMHVREYFFDEFSMLFSKRSDMAIIRHTCSHPLVTTIVYNSIVQCFRFKIPIIKYIMNSLALITGKSPFLSENQKTPMTYQFITLRKK